MILSINMSSDLIGGSEGFSMENVVAAIKEKQKDIVFRNRALAKSSKMSYSEAVRQYMEYLKETGQAEGVEAQHLVQPLDRHPGVDTKRWLDVA